MDAAIRPMQVDDAEAVADLIYLSTNFWYQTHGHTQIFQGGPQVTKLFPTVYGALAGSAGLVAEARPGQVLASCFYHIRPTHVSLGIMNVHPNYFGHGLARRLLGSIITIAEREDKPLRLVASAMNLDSYSLYTRAGFVPRRAYQDMVIDVPSGGLDASRPDVGRIRVAELRDVDGMAAVETAVSHIRRDSDYRHFIENLEGFWHVSVIENDDGRLDGFLVSSGHPGCNMLGPGVARTEQQAAALILSELDLHRGRTPVFLVPVDCDKLVQSAYRWGARNCEMHFAQVRGEFEGFSGVNLPTFMPETG